MTMDLHCDRLTVSLGTGPDMANITNELAEIVRRSGIVQGALLAANVGSTGSLTTIEYEPGVVEDLKRALERMVPRGMEYEHERAWHDGNGHSHVQAALMGPSIHVPVRSGALALGTWQQVVVVNHDNGPRKRVVEVTVVGCKTSTG
jgi:secondary thiamine-phosphate synthase enzyme